MAEKTEAELEDAIFAEAAAKSDASRGIVAKVDEPAEEEEPKSAPEKEPEPQAPAKAETPATEAKGDIWANATPEQRAALDEAKAWEQKYKAEQGKVPGLQRRLRELEASKEPAAPAKTSTPPASPAKPTSLREDTRYKQLLEDYPDLMSPVVDSIEELRKTADEMKGNVTSLAEERRQRDLDANEAIVDAKLPEWRQLIGTPGTPAHDQFKEWVEGRSKGFRQIVDRNAEAVVDAEEVLDVVGSYSAHLKLLARESVGSGTKPAGQPAPTNHATKRAEQLAAARAPASRSSTASPVGAGGDESDALWDEAVKKVAKRQG